MSTKEKLKTILKFDVGADGFQKMIYVLALGAVIVLAAGLFFIQLFLNEMRQI